MNHSTIDFFSENRFSVLYIAVVCPYGHGYSYPSGHLALIILSSKKERICIIHDDMATPLCPVRALFQSNGRSTCYHSNGSIW